MTQRIADTLDYLVLGLSLTPGGMTKAGIRQTIMQTYEWLRSATPEEVQAKEPALRGLFERALVEVDAYLPPVATRGEIVRHFRELRQAGEFSWSHGIALHWLRNQFDLSPLKIPEDMPWHAHVGVGHHAGHVVVEEQDLLKDAFFILAKSRAAL